MSNREIIFELLSSCGCLNSKQISAKLKREKNISLSPAAVSGALRPLVAQGKVANSNCGYGSTVYWVMKNRFEKENANAY